jgi:diaminopimelate epimerase
MSAEPNLHKVTFTKMSGAGNDFVIIDARKKPVPLSLPQIRQISERKNIGCDQLIIIKNSSGADCLMEIYNADGSSSKACGNATRCVAAILLSESKSNLVRIETAAGILKCWQEEFPASIFGNKAKNNQISDFNINGFQITGVKLKSGAIQNNNIQAVKPVIAVEMGIPDFCWTKIPLARAADAQKIMISNLEFACVNVGNPHAVAFVSKQLTDAEFFAIGPQVENNPVFLEKTNVEFARILADDLIEVRVWERGAGETLACGSGACAVAVLAIKKNLITKKKIIIRFKGGDLTICWQGDKAPVIMSGEYKKIFHGIIDIENF